MKKVKTNQQLAANSLNYFVVIWSIYSPIYKFLVKIMIK